MECLESVFEDIEAREDPVADVQSRPASRDGKAKIRQPSDAPPRGPSRQGRSRWHPHWRHLGAIATAIILVGSGELGPFANVAQASCNPNRSRLDGAYQAGVVGQPSPYPDGVTARTDEYSPYYTGNNHTGTLMSVMIDKGLTMWAQVGWDYHVNNQGSKKRQIFVEHVDGLGNNLWFYWAANPVGSTTTYKITFDASNHHFHYLVDGSEYANLGASGSLTPTRWEIFGETHDQADQMPGGTSSHAKFRSAKTRLHGSSIWSDANGTVHANGSPLNGASGLLGSFDIWDAKCSS